MRIDTKKWIPPSALAKKLKVGKQVVNNWIIRGKIKVLDVPEWDIRLVDAAHLVAEREGRLKKISRGSKTGINRADDFA